MEYYPTKQIEVVFEVFNLLDEKELLDGSLQMILANKLMQLLRPWNLSQFFSPAGHSWLIKHDSPFEACLFLQILMMTENIGIMATVFCHTRPGSALEKEVLRAIKLQKICLSLEITEDLLNKSCQVYSSNIERCQQLVKDLL